MMNDEIYHTKVRVHKSHEAFLDILQRRKCRFYIRETRFMAEVVLDGMKHVFIKKSEYLAKDVHIFRVVKGEALKFLEQNPDFQPQEQYKSNMMNYDYDDTIGVLTGTDLNSAYWTIARNMGIISDKTFEKYSDSRYKIIRLSALSVLGRRKAYKSFHGSDNKGVFILENENPMLREIYRAIRFECFRHMTTLAEKLGKDFDSYRTDCIYYRDTPENRKLVYDYFDANRLTYKQLVFGEEEAED